MPISADELVVYDPLVRLAQRVSEYAKNDPDVYIRLRRKPFGERPKVFGDQIWPAQNPDFLAELVDRIAGSNTSDPVLVELIPKGKSKTIDLCEVPPLIEAMEHLMAARFDAAKVNGESQVMIAQSELIGRICMGLMQERTQFFTAWKEAENENLRIRADLLETQLFAEWGGGDEPEDPDVVKWRELGKAFRDVAVKGMDPLQALGRYLDARVNAGAKPPPAKPENGSGAPVTPEPAPSSADAPQSAESAPEGTEETEYTSPDEIADTTLDWLVEILESAPELLTPERLMKLAPHKRQLKLALGVLEAIAPDDQPVDPEPTSE